MKKLQKNLNTVVTISVVDKNAEKDPSYFAGATLRFHELPDSIKDAKGQETVISDKGTGEIRFRVLAHLLADAPAKMELVKIEGDKEQLLKRFSVKIKVPTHMDKFDTFNMKPSPDGTHLSLTASVSVMSIGDIYLHTSTGILTWELPSYEKRLYSKGSR